MPSCKYLPLLMFLLATVPAYGQDAALRGADDPLAIRGGLADGTEAGREETEETRAATREAERRAAETRRRLRGLSVPESSPRSAPASRPISSPIERPFAEEPERVVENPRRRPSLTEDEGGTFFEPTGIVFGSFRLFPSLGLFGGYTNDAGSTAAGTASYLYRVEPELTFRSQWSRHALDLTLRGTYDGFTANGVANEPSFDAGLRGRIDLSARTTVEVTGDYSFEMERLSSAEAPAGASRSAETHSLTGGLAVTHRPGRLGYTFGIDADRTLFTGGDYVDGDRDNLILSSRLRLTYFGGGSIRPYLQGGALTRLYDKKTDSNGYRRDSIGYDLRAGMQLDFGPKLTGDINAGYRSEFLDDGRLAPLAGVAFDASLIWSPYRLTQVTASANTSFEATSIADASGSTVYSGTLGLRQSIRRNLQFNGTAGLSYTAYTGFARKDLTASAELGLTWALSPALAFSAVYNVERLFSSENESDYLDNTIRLGIVFRR